MSNWYQLAGDVGGGPGSSAPAEGIVSWATEQTPQQWADIFTGGAVSATQERIAAAEAAARQARTLLTLTLGVGVVGVGLLLYIALRPSQAGF